MRNRSFNNRNFRHRNLRHDEASVYKAYTDFSLALVIVLLLMITVTKKKELLDNQAEYQASIEWDRMSDTDIDIYASYDLNKPPIYFSNKSSAGISLDRDSRGYISDRIKNDDKTLYLPHREIITIRGNIERTVIFGAQFYRYSDSPHYKIPDLQHINLNIHFEVIKINPSSKEIYKIDKPLNYVGDALNFVTIHFKPDATFEFVDSPIEAISNKVLHDSSFGGIPGAHNYAPGGGTPYSNSSPTPDSTVKPETF
jgi:hypothetical protein